MDTMTTRMRIEDVWTLLERLTDPEIPVISLRELGILREVRESADGLEVIITPTYSGCPAMEQIEADVRGLLAEQGIAAKVTTRLSPAWTTDWMTDAGKEKLRQYGIAPPVHKVSDVAVMRFVPRTAERKPEAVPCPQCGSQQTVESAHFGSTACKALYRCLDCRETFDYFKPY
jgi:ring-1,2-phenylacetyl-CoA epoxidase subunit PaaD